jgi:GT2 family glycosyltransferase
MSHSHNPSSRPYRDVPSVGVVVLNYNHSELTINCVNSLLKQEYENFNIVVVDNNSPDEAQKIILQTSLPKSVILILNPENKGYAAGNNVGARYCKEAWDSDFVFVLNNDTILEDPKTIETLVKTFEDNKIVAVSPLVDTTSAGINVENQIQVRKLLNPYKTLVCNVIFLSKLPFFKRFSREFLYLDWMPYTPSVYHVDSINGSAFMIRTATLEAIGYLNEKTFLYAEEVILGCQIKELGKTCALNGQTVVKHYQGLSTGNDRYKINWTMHKYSIDSMCIVFEDYYQRSKAFILCFRFLRIIDFIIKRFYL